MALAGGRRAGRQGRGERFSVRYLPGSRRGSTPRTAQKMWERYGKLHHRRLRSAGCRGRRLARLRMVGGQEGRRGGRRVSRLRSRLLNEGKNKEAEEAFAKIAAERHVELPHARQVPRSGRAGAARPEGGGRDLRPACRRQQPRPRAAGSGGGARRHDPGRHRALQRHQATAGAADGAGSRRSATARARCSRSRPGAPTTRRRCGDGPT